MAIDSASEDPGNAESYYQYALCLTQQAALAPDGKIVPPPGAVDAFQKYRELTPSGPMRYARVSVCSIPYTAVLPVRPPATL